MSNNQTVGKNAEQMFLNHIDDAGGYATLIPPSMLGQPFDAMAVYRNKVWFVDVKNCRGRRFSFSNIRPNQMISLKLLASKRGNLDYKVGFVIYVENQKIFKYFDYRDYEQMFNRNEKGISVDDSRLVRF